MTKDSILQQIIDKARAESHGDASGSTGERLAAALVLNRPELLEAMGFTLAEAIDRVGPQWLARIPAAARQLADEEAVVQAALQKAKRTSAEEAFTSRWQEDYLEFNATLDTYGSAPGYRDVHFYLTLTPRYADSTAGPAKVVLHMGGTDSEKVLRVIAEAHDCAWRKGEPIDVKVGECKPRWIDAVAPVFGL